MNCSKCGAAIPNDAKFCCYCGAEIVEYDHNDVSSKLDQILKFLKGKQPEPAENKKEIVKSHSMFKDISNEISQMVAHSAESLKAPSQTESLKSPSSEELKKGYYVRNGILMLCFDKNVQEIYLDLDDSVKEAYGLKIYKKLSRVMVSGAITRLPKGLLNDCRGISFLDIQKSNITEISADDLKGTGLCQLMLPSCFRLLNSGSFNKDNFMYLTTISSDHFFAVKPDALPSSYLDRSIFNINGHYYNANQVNKFRR